MEKYLNKLIEQFKSATGFKNVDVNSREFIEEFCEWLVKYRKIMKDYTSFVEQMEVHPTVIGRESVEIGKGIFDSIALDIGDYMITPYFEGIKRTDSGIINADFYVYAGAPTIIRHNKGGDQLEIVNTQYIRRFITHNPYEQSCIRNWEQLHNVGENITVCIFGSIYDKDIEQKTRQIDALRDSMTDNSFKEDYTTEKDNYYYVVSSTRKVKVLEKVRKRIN